MEPVHARSKAAAWAWYQRGSGSPAAIATPQSEAASRGTLSIRFVRGGSPSRFKLEAEFLLSNAPIDEAADRLKSLHLLPHSANSSSRGYDVAMTSIGMLAASPSNLIGSAALGKPEDLAIAMSSFSYGTASWDCGSALFDSFELVAMSKKLDDAHQLTVEKVCPQYEEDSSADNCGRIDAITEGANEEEEERNEETNTGFLSDDGHLLMSINDSCGLDADSDVQGAWYNCEQSKQAIYDMFCRYDNMQTPPGGSVCENDEHIKKQYSTPAMSPASARSSKQYRRRRLHSLSKAFRHHFMQLTSQSRMRPSSSIHRQPPADESCLLESASLPAKGSPNSHIHHHKSTCALGSPGRVDLTKAEGCGLQASSPSLRKQYSSDDGHHHHHHYHHHHHHHFLFQHHSDDGFGVLPAVTPQLMATDKSHLVAAAGLRASKVSSLRDYLLFGSKLEGGVLDPKRRWGDHDRNSVASAMEAHAFSISQE